MLWLLPLLACAPTSPPRAPATPPQPVEVRATALARTPDGLTLTLPPTTRPGGAPPPARFSPHGAVRRAEQKGGAVIWEVPLPAHSNLFPSPQAGARSFGNWAPEGLTVRLGDRELSFKRFAAGPWTWGYDREHLRIGLPADAPPPTAEDLVLTWPKATRAEAALHLSTSGQDPVAFALRSVTLGEESTTGVLLPAPGEATWKVTIPPDGVLTLRGTILPPAIAAGRDSDGATLRISVDGAEAAAHPLRPDGWTPVRVDLAAWAGRVVPITLRSDPGATSDLDLVFLEEPTVYTPSPHPRRLVIGFLDTVRRDHLGVYGYPRPTTPRLDAWAAGALRLDQARTVAPWTLPSARAVLTGAQPELFDETPTLPARLAAAGWVTDGVVANAYLSQTFDMHRGFGRYRYAHLLPAAALVDHAEAVFTAWPDRDVLVWVQFMEAHLPYMEPKAYRTLFTGDRPAELSEVSRVELVKLDGDEPHFEAVRAHVTGRYDQNLRVLDDEVSRLIAAAGPDATVALFSDHGEELWDHGAFEHGHAFWDELLRVPVLLADPHLPAGVLAEPTSLLDLTPTVLELVGLPHAVPHGQSLVPAAYDARGAREVLARRPQAFGRPLYGADGWGVVHDDHKWWSRDGAEVLLDVRHGEQLLPDDAARRGAMPTAAAAALGRELVRVWRVQLTAGPRTAGARLELDHPDGLVRAWRAYAPRGEEDGVAPEEVDRRIRVVPRPDQRLPAVLYVQPTGALSAGLTITIHRPGAPPVTATVDVAASSDAVPAPLLRPVADAFDLRVDTAWVPLPAGREVSGFAPELRGQLEELGYLGEE